eukprot:3042231-Amphidinium_carterae.1
MLATMGYITPEITGKLPGYLSPSQGIAFEGIPNGLGAISKIPAEGYLQMFAYTAYCELSQDQQPGSKGAAGDFGLLTNLVANEETLKKRQQAELANGRLAMMAIISMFFQDGLTGEPLNHGANELSSPDHPPLGMGNVRKSGGADETYVHLIAGSAWGDWANYTASPLR